MSVPLFIRRESTTGQRIVLLSKALGLSCELDKEPLARHHRPFLVSPNRGSGDEYTALDCA